MNLTALICCAKRTIQLSGRLAVVGLFAAVPLLFAKDGDSFHRSMDVKASEPVVLDIDVPKGELRIYYLREGQVSVSATVRSSQRMDAEQNVAASISLLQDGNHITIGYTVPPGQVPADVLYTLDVPYRTSITSMIDEGKTIVSGVMGPVRTRARRGDIRISYVTSEVAAQADVGDLDFQVLGGRVEARTGQGNISCMRAALGVTAETQAGDVTLMVVGPSIATVKSGTGRINIGGARGSLQAVTDSGELQVRAVPQGDWQLRSVAGDIKVEMPATARYAVDAVSTSGEIVVGRDDLMRPGDPHHLRQVVNEGVTRIDLKTEAGRVFLR